MTHTCNPSTLENLEFRAVLCYIGRPYLRKKIFKEIIKPTSHRGEKDQFIVPPCRLLVIICKMKIDGGELS